MQIKLGREEIANKEGKSGYFQLNLAHTTRRRNQAPQPGAATRRRNQALQRLNIQHELSNCPFQSSSNVFSIQTPWQDVFVIKIRIGLIKLIIPFTQRFAGYFIRGLSACTRVPHTKGLAFFISLCDPKPTRTLQKTKFHLDRVSNQEPLVH